MFGAASVDCGSPCMQRNGQSNKMALTLAGVGTYSSKSIAWCGPLSLDHISFACGALRWLCGTVTCGCCIVMDAPNSKLLADGT